jgi:L-seryl-tRNA(Ser) seleniumtransferase
MSVYDRFAIPTIINACGTNTRLGGALMAPEVTAAMAEAATASVEMPDLQAGASRVIARVTGAEAGIVTSGASAALLLAAAACLARLDPAAMNRLPRTGGRNAFIVMRGQRNMYDRALIVAGGTIVEVGIPDRYSGPGVRDADAWEVEAAITPDTAAIVWLAQPQSLPTLPEIVRVARAHAVPVLVDAAAQLPPADNLRRFIAEGADLVAFSGGKAIGGPQSTGILCGRRDLVSSALMQMLDLDLFPEHWHPPPEFAPLGQLPGLPHHGIGRSGKVGKEEVIGLLVALERFAAADEAARRRAWCDRLAIIQAASAWPDARIADRPVPLLELPAADPDALCAHLLAHAPPIHASLAQRHLGLITISPIAITDAQARAIGAWLRRWAG